MSVPPGVMQRMMSGAGQGGGAPTAGGATPPPGPEAGAGSAPPGQSPAAAPMSKPQDKRGLKAAAGVNLHIATNMLEEALPAYGSESPEGGKILQALKILGGLIGKRDHSDLVPADVLQLYSRLPQMGGGTEIQQMLRKMQASKPPQPAPSA